MKFKIFLPCLFAIGIMGLSLPEKPEADIGIQDGTAEALPNIIPVDNFLSVDVKRLDPIDNETPTGETPTAYAASSDNSVFEPDDFLKRDRRAFRRTANLALKSAVHGVTGTFTWIIQIAINPNHSKSKLGPDRIGATIDLLSSTSDSTTISFFNVLAADQQNVAIFTDWLAGFDVSAAGGLLSVDADWREMFQKIGGSINQCYYLSLNGAPLYWTQNGQTELIDPSQYTFSISES